MAWTGQLSTGAFFNTGIGIARIHGGIEYNTSRTNNTVYFTGTRAIIQYIRESGSWGSFTYGSGWTWRLQVGGQRAQNSASGTRSVNQQDWGSYADFSVGVGMNDTGYTGYVSAWFAGDGETWTGGLGISIPALGAPAGNTTFDSRTDTTLKVRNDVTTWGANATSGSVRSYRADNSGFSGQTYIGTSDNALVTHSGLSPNTRYWFRGWADNGGGKSAYMSTIDATTLANASETSKNVQATTVDFILAVAQGYRTTTAKVQYRKTGDTTWIDSPTGAGGTPSIAVTGLLPSTQYDYRLIVTTTDGTWEGATSTFTTLPAAKIVMPDGTVKNAIPHVIQPGGTAEMVQVKVIQP